MINKTKESGYDWLGIIPSNWITKKGYVIYDINTGSLDANAEEPDGKYPFFTCSDEKKTINTYSFDCEALLVAGNGHVGFTQYYNGKFDAYQRTYVLSNFKMVKPAFLKYYFPILFPMSLESQSFGSVIEFIKKRNLKNFIIPVPSENEQNNIIKFLDAKCFQIDELISKHNLIIEKLDDYRKSIISETVTKGLDSNTKMKESQTYWIDEIPISWNIVPLKTRFEFGKGLSITKADLVEKGLPVISYGQIHSKNCSGVHITRDLIRYVPEEYSLYKDSFAKKNDFIFADTSEDLEGCGNCIYVDNDGVYAGYHTVLLSSKYNDNNKYLGYLFRTDIWRYQIRTKLTEVKLYSITQGCLKQIEILLPSTDEQNDIVEYLDKKCLAIDKLIAKQKESIEKLEEYKKSLIYNVITGKMEVK